MTLRIGLVGTKVMGAKRARVLAAAVGGAQFSAVADLNMARAHDVAASVGAEVFRDPLVYSVDAVVIASHKLLALRAGLRHGILNWRMNKVSGW